MFQKVFFNLLIIKWVAINNKNERAKNIKLCFSNRFLNNIIRLNEIIIKPITFMISLLDHFRKVANVLDNTTKKHQSVVCSSIVYSL